MIARVKGWALVSLAVLLMLVGAYGTGRRAARKAADIGHELDNARRAAAGAKEAQDVRNEVRSMPRSAVRDELARDWVRADTQK